MMTFVRSLAARFEIFVKVNILSDTFKDLRISEKVESKI